MNCSVFITKLDSAMCAAAVQRSLSNAIHACLNTECFSCPDQAEPDIEHTSKVCISS